MVVRGTITRKNNRRSEVCLRSSFIPSTNHEGKLTDDGTAGRYRRYRRLMLYDMRSKRNPRNEGTAYAQTCTAMRRICDIIEAVRCYGDL